jgi:1-deoxy-D-xylulose-5-phosphate synthase
MIVRLKELIKNLKKLNEEEINELCKCLREYIIDVVSTNGGHLASSLGAVELSVLLHRLLKTPEDKLIWDVGHQAYAHKILTGRIDEFKTLRTYGGISGFPRTCESEHDAFSVGHSSTSISAAVGYAVSKKQHNKKNSIVAVIGDGSISSGMPFEAMNQASQIKDLDITVILNDNEMSISPNVGALSRYFNNLRTDPIYIGIRDDVEYLVSKIPAIGKNMISVMERVSTGLKTVIDPGAFFLHLGWDYYGPVDGHDLNALNKILKKVLKIKGLKILHVITKKGKGYLPAELEPSKFHGVGPFNRETGELGKSSTLSATGVVSDYLVKLGEEFKNLNVITAAMPDGTGTKKFGETFPDRYFDIGISEEHATTFAAGMALDGLIPVVAIYSTFMQRSIDQIMHDVALQKLPVIFLLDRGGVVGEDGGTHHGTFDYSFMRMIPDMIVSAPKDCEELKDMMYTAVKQRLKPFSIRYARGKIAYSAPRDRKIIEPGSVDIIKEGGNIAVVTNSYIVEFAQNGLEDINCGIYNFRFVKPLDYKVVKKICDNYKKVIIFEDNTICGGLGSAFLEECAEFENKPVIILKGIPDDFVEHGDQDILREKLGFSANSIRDFMISHGAEIEKAY